MNTEPFAFVGPLIHSLSLTELEIIENGTIVVSSGKIIHLSDTADSTEIKKKYGVKEENIHILGKDNFLIPGLIDTHTHAPQYPNIGLGYDKPLLDWLDTYTFPLEMRMKDETFAERVYETVVRRTVENGTTTCTYYATVHVTGSIILAKVAQRVGQRAFIGKINMNMNCPEELRETFEQAICNTKSFIEEIGKLNDSLIKPIITPRFALSCDLPLMKSLAQLANEYNLLIQTHVSENKKEVELVEELYSDNYVNVYDKAGLVTKKTILAHGVYLKPEEIQIIKDRNATISHCANSNLTLHSGICPVRRLLNAGVKVSLGTDCSGGYSCSMLSAIRDTINSSILADFHGLGSPITYGEAFYLATLAGAEALNISHLTGNFKVGKNFDAVVVSMRNNPAVDLLGDYSPRELFEKFIYLGDDRFISKVFVAGKLIKG